MAKAAKKENLDDLKQELDIDYHKITAEELYQRFQTHPENVSKFLARDYVTQIIYSMLSITGSQSCKGQRKFRTRRAECPYPSKANTRMD